MGDIPQIFAQESATEEFTLEEITVTAQKREMDVQKTPIAIQAVTADQLVEEAKQRLDEIMQGVVGVASQGSQVGTDFYIRGIGTGNFGPPTGGLDQAAVAVMIDGVYQNRGEVVRGGTLDMQRVEIMRGTQSTTLGGSSLAGAVSLVSNNPVFKYEGSGSLDLGNYHLIGFQGMLNVPLSDSQALRFAYSTDKRDGYLSSGAGDSDLTNARVKYRLQATEAIEIIATYNHQDIGGNGVDTGVLQYDGYWEGYNAANAANYNTTMTLQNSPKWSANASYSHMFTLPSGSTLTPKLNLEYKGTYWSMGGGPNADIANHAFADQAAYTLWNAYLNWASSDGQFNVNAYVKNIQNKPILTNVGSEAGYKTVSLAQPRTFGVLFSARF